MDEEHDLTEVEGDGGTERVDDEELKALRDEIDQIRSEISGSVASQRTSNAETRFCQWEGQSDDGRKHKEDLGKDAFPFEGASDTRCRTTDQVINENVRDYLLAATRAIPKVIGTESNDEALSGRMQAVLRWLIRNKWGSRYRDELELVGQWMEGDTPAVAAMHVYWDKELAIESRRVTKQELVTILLEAMSAAGEVLPEAAEDLVDVIENPARIEELKGAIGALYPNLTRSRLAEVVDDLYSTGEAEFPVEYVRESIPQIEALRFYEDLFCAANVRDVQRIPVFLRRWLTAAEVREQAARDGWEEEFVEELLGEGDHEGQGMEAKSAFTEETTSDEDQKINPTTMDLVETHRGLYEVIWGYTRATNEAGAMGAYVRVFSYHCKAAATDRQLLEEKHGQYPFIVFVRERMTRRLLNSRSVSELGQTQQNSLKLVTDSIEDHVQVLTNPPVKKPRGSPKYQVALAPFGEVEVGPRETLEFLERPAYPRAAMDHRAWIQKDVDDYFGRENGEIPEGRTLTARQHRVDRFLGALKDVHMMSLQLIQQHMTDEDLVRVGGVAGLPQTVQEIQGKFDLQLSFDLRDTNQEYLLKKGEMLLKYVRPLDTQGLLPWGTFMRSIVEGIDPNWADMIPNEAQAQMRILTEEQMAYVKILSGVEPPMAEELEAPQLRLQVLQNLHAPRMQNPQAFSPMTPAAAALLENRLRFLQQQAVQQENALIGRLGTSPVDLATVGQEGAVAR